MSRRSVLKAGAAGVGAGITILALPQAAAASSPVIPAPTPPEPIKLDGEWEIFQSKDDADFLRFFAFFDEPESGNPSGLTVPGVTGLVPFIDIDDTKDNQIFWELELDGGFTESGDLVGTFTWDGQPYEVTFEELDG